MILDDPKNNYEINSSHKSNKEVDFLFEMAENIEPLIVTDSIPHPASTDNLLKSNDCDEKTKQNGFTQWRDLSSMMILFVVNLLNYMDRFTVAGVLTELQQFFEMDDSEAGLLQTVFIFFYMVFAPICGYLGDRYNRKWIMAGGIFVWSGAVFCSSFVPRNHFWAFLVCRGIVGIGEASYSTVSPTLIADLFTGKMRSRMLMFFYFAIPVGSGLGFIVGANVASLTNHWQWGVRVTPVLGIVSLLLILFVLREPTRGEADHAHLESTSFWEDIQNLVRNRTYIYSTLGFTSVVFVTGSMSWWTPTTVEHAWAMRRHISSAPQGEKGRISLIFGIITCLAGFGGVTVGSMTAQLWRDGKACLSHCGNPRADAYICALGSLLAVPFLFAALQFLPDNADIAWLFVFLAVMMMCLNWAVIVDMLLYIVVPTRRATASAFQILFSHLFGDAASPYVIGVALYIPNLVLIVSAGFFFVVSFYVENDRQKASHDMHELELAADRRLRSNDSDLSTNQLLVNSDPIDEQLFEIF